MMDRAHCAQVQETISAALDGEAPDAASFAAAKAHCEGCAECAEFVTLLADIRRLPKPEIPEEVLDRVLHAVRAEIAGEQRATAPETATGNAESRGRLTVVLDSRDWRAWAPWAAAAAMFFVAAGFAAALGVRYLLTPSPVPQTSEISLGGVEDGVPQTDESRGGAAEAESAMPPANDSAITAESAASPAYVTLAQRVYRLDSTVEMPPAPGAIGEVTTALGSGGTPVSRRVFSEPDGTAIVVEGDGGTYLRFVPVTRTFQGRVFELNAQAITAFGVWPSLPSGFPQPSSASGAPELVLAGSDDSGVEIFASPGASPLSGFAIAPGTASGDPAAGNPQWTWWKPAAP